MRLDGTATNCLIRPFFKIHKPIVALEVVENNTLPFNSAGAVGALNKQQQKL